MPESLINKFWDCVVGIIAISVLAVVFYVGGSIVVSNGKIDYCYVSTWVETTNDPNTGTIQYHTLYGHRPWRSDERIFQTTFNVQETLDVANAMNCEVR